jgi:PPP family 3-phenylpropionic acid transporter
MTDNSNYKRTAFLLSSFFFLHYATLGIIFPFTGYYFKLAGFSGTEIGIFLSIFPLVKFLLTARWLHFFSKVKNKNLFVATCVVISTFAIFPLTLTNNRLLVGLILFIFSVTRTGVIPVIDSIAVSMDSHIPYGRIRLFGSIGFICTSIIGGMLMDKIGPSAFVWTYTAAGLLAAVPAFLTDYSGDFLKPRSKAERKLTPELAVFFLGVTVYLTSFGFLSNFFNIKVSEAGYSQTWAGYMWSIGVLTEIVFLYNQEIILKMFRVKTLLALSMFMAGVRYLVTGYTDSLLVLCIFSTFNGFAYGGVHIAIMRYIRRYVPDRLKLKAQGMYSGFGYGLGTIIGSLISGIIYDISGIQTVFAASFVLCTAAAMIIYFLTGKTEEA